MKKRQEQYWALRLRNETPKEQEILLYVVYCFFFQSRIELKGLAFKKKKTFIECMNNGLSNRAASKLTVIPQEVMRPSCLELGRHSHW